MGLTAVRVDPAERLRGELRPPADKSISHRAAILGAMAAEPVRIRGYLDAADTNSTLDAVRASARSSGRRRRGRSSAAPACATPPSPTARSTSATPGRSCACCRAGWPGRRALVHARRRRLDPPAARRPHRRAAAPDGRARSTPPTGGCRRSRSTARACARSTTSCRSPARRSSRASCWPRLVADGATTVSEPAPSRDHTERMLAAAGVTVHRNGRHVTVAGTDELTLDELVVPGDPSSAAFAIAAGVLVPGSRLVLRGVGVNWTRTGFLRIAQRMGGDRGRRPRGRARRRGGHERADQRPRRRRRPAGRHRRRGRRGAAGHRRAAAGRPCWAASPRARRRRAARRSCA